MRRERNSPTLRKNAYKSDVTEDFLFNQQRTNLKKEKYVGVRNKKCEFYLYRENGTGDRPGNSSLAGDFIRVKGERRLSCVELFALSGTVRFN